MLLVCLLTGCPFSVSQAAEPIYDIDIPAMNAAEALNRLAEQTGAVMLFSYDLARVYRANSVRGRYTLLEGLELLLRDTGLSGGLSDKRVIAISEEGNMAASNVEGARKRGLLATIMAVLANGPATGALADQEQQLTPLTEIVVTARKRAESILDVPVSIAVVTADDIDRRGLVSSEDFLRGIPGVSQTTDRIGQSITIRGIETSPTAQNSFSGATVATYFGETSTTSSGGLAGNTSVDIKLVDIDRVEVLRGPQGTTFGNSSMGGAMRLIPVAPNLDDFEGRVSAGYSVTSENGDDNYNVQAVGNFALIKDRLAIRAAAYQFDDSGFYRNNAGSDPSFLAAIAPYGAEAFAVDDDNVGHQKFVGGRIAALIQANENLKFTLTYLTQTTEVDGQALANTGIYEQSLLQVAPEHVVRNERAGVSDSDIDLANATMEYDLGWADLVATYSYVDSGSTFFVPFTTFDLPWPVSAGGPSSQRADSGELRLATRLSGPWNFLGGLYLEELEDEFPQDFYWYGDPATNFFTPGETFLGSNLDRRTLKQKAAFGEVSWAFQPRFTVTAGVRAFDYERTARNDTTGFFFGETSTSLDADESGTTFRGNVSYKPSDDALLYASWAQGFRLGRPQPGVPPGLCDLNGDGIIDGTSTTIESTTSVDSDSLDSYELGAKVAFLDRRLTFDGAIFRIDWSDVPVLVTAQCPSITFAYTANAGGARSEGVEFQANFQLTESFRVDFGSSWIDAKLTEDVPAEGLSSGDRLPGSPGFNANIGLQYDFNIGDYKASLRGDSIYVGSFYGDMQESPETRAGDYVKADISARVTINNLDLDLFVRNVTNADDFTFRGTVPRSYGHRLRPRTVGLQLSYDF